MTQNLAYELTPKSRGSQDLLQRGSVSRPILWSNLALISSHDQVQLQPADSDSVCGNTSDEHGILRDL